jgi:hypothetical protein
VTNDLSDAAVRTVLDVYAAIDAGRARSAGDWFTGDAVFETSTSRAKGLEAVKAFLAAREADTERRTLHVLSNIRASRTSAGDAEIDGVLFVYVPGTAEPGPPWVLQHVAPVHHVLRSVDDRWLLAARVPGERGA